MAVDWIDAFVARTEVLQVPASFRRWAAISCVASVMERRVFTRSYRGVTFPNLYVVLAAAPGVGKGLVIGEVRRLLSRVGDVYLAPDDVTKASFLDELAKAVRTYNTTRGVLICSPISIAIREFGVFVPRYDGEFLNVLTDLFDNPDTFDSVRRQSTSVDIEKPTVNILGAVTPDFLGEILPEVAWSQGFCSRFVFVYGAKSEESTVDLFAEPDGDARRTAELLPTLKELYSLSGEFGWDPAARIMANDWANDGEKPVPGYSRLRHYNSRRRQLMMRLAMLSALSAGHELCVHGSDVERALCWMVETEETMPDIFRAMGAKSDDQLLRDLHYHCYTIYNSVARDKRKALDSQVLWEYLRTKAPAERITKLLAAATSCGLFTETLSGLYVPCDLSKVGGTV